MPPGKPPAAVMLAACSRDAAHETYSRRKPFRVSDLVEHDEAPTVPAEGARIHIILPLQKDSLSTTCTLHVHTCVSPLFFRVGTRLQHTSLCLTNTMACLATHAYKLTMQSSRRTCMIFSLETIPASATHHNRLLQTSHRNCFRHHICFRHHQMSLTDVVSLD